MAAPQLSCPEPPELTAQKRAARRAARAIAAEIPPAHWQAMGAAMAQRLFALPCWRQAEAVFCFVSMANEPDTLPILRRALAEGRPMYLPRMLGGGRMEAVLLPGGGSALANLTFNAYGIAEPAPCLYETLAADRFPAGALAVLPCLAAGADGTRLGRGGGYYDRFLARYTGQSVLLCPAALVRPTLPAGPLDRPVPAVLTENGLLMPASPEESARQTGAY